MNKNKLYLILLLPLVLFLFPASSQAAPSIPPTDECVALTQEMLDQYRELAKGNNYVTDQEERKLWRPIVEAGCLETSPMNNIPETKKCKDLLGDASAYFAPANAALRPHYKRLMQVSRNFAKRSQVVYKKIDQASKRGQKKRIRALARKLEKLEKKFEQKYYRVIQNAAGKIELYAAPVLLVYADLYTRGCKIPESWVKQNNPVLLALFFWDYGATTSSERIGQMLNTKQSG